MIVNSLCYNRSGSLFAGTKSRGLYRSTNNGATWVRLLNIFNNVNALGCNSSNQLYAATEKGIFKSTDTGSNWILSDSTISNVNKIIFNQQDHIFAATNYGVFSSTNSGANWVNLIWNYADVVDINAGPNGNIFATSDDLNSQSALWRSTDLGSTWMNVLTIDTVIFCIRINSQNQIYAGSAKGVLYSSNNGTNWSYIGLGSEQVNAIRFNSNNYIFCATNHGVFYSTNNGAVWSNITPVTSDYRSIAIDNNDRIYCGNISSQIWKSTNNGSNWNLVYTVPYSAYIYTIATNSIGDVYAAGNGFYRSTDFGSSWTLQGFEFNTVDNIVVTPNNHIYFNSNYPYRSTDNGVTFQQLSTGIVNNIQSICYHPSGYLFASSFNWGAFISQYLTEVNEPVPNAPEKFSLSQNYPNPFNPTTNIVFAIPKTSFAKLIIYDISGRQVQTLVNEELKAGTYKADFDGAGFASGIYFYTLSANDYMQTKKMVLIK